MSTPGPEARIAAQESLTALLHAQIKQLSLDMQANFTEVKQELKHLVQDKTGWEEVDAYLKLMATKDDIKPLATKEDIKDMATKSDIRRLEADITSIKDTQEQILKLLQQKSGE